ncbi:hypothetical protein [Tsukamurella pulmonis]|uniref:hypothetical protein n=1 Tax=Tsukamurella pulmonis TaxID=47312 RepID=UPI0020C74FA7|nr:hypothetical protein [Tsukamurella pulmonis]
MTAGEVDRVELGGVDVAQRRGVPQAVHEDGIVVAGAGAALREHLVAQRLGIERDEAAVDAGDGGGVPRGLDGVHEVGQFAQPEAGATAADRVRGDAGGDDQDAAHGILLRI